MPLTLQDDLGQTSTADAYISVDEFYAHHSARGNFPDAGKPDIERAIVAATDYLDLRYKYLGSKLNGRDQATQWPRSNARDRDGSSVQGIPAEVKMATAEYALSAISGPLIPDLAEDKSGRQIASKETKFGPITNKVSYVGRGQSQFKSYPKADRMLVNLLNPGGMIELG